MLCRSGRGESRESAAMRRISGVPASQSGTRASSRPEPNELPLGEPEDVARELQPLLDAPLLRIAVHQLCGAQVLHQLPLAYAEQSRGLRERDSVVVNLASLLDLGEICHVVDVHLE